MTHPNGGLWRDITIADLAANTPNACVIGPFGSDLKVSDYVDVGVPIVFVRNVRPGQYCPAGGRFVSQEKAADLASHQVLPGDLVITKMGLPPCVTAIYPETEPPGIITADIIKLTLDSTKADAGFITHYLNSTLAKGEIKRITNGVTRPKVTLADFRRISVKLPAVPEQKRIAAILDKSDGIRRKRREAVELAGRFRRSVFQDLFGIPTSGETRWPLVTFARTCNGDLRNGISPATSGQHEGKVLVLSAITGPIFDHAAVKPGKFTNESDDGQLVKANEFLICRGNGNLNLVGAGRFPLHSLDDTVFPDTMIAARINREMLEPAYLEEVWATPFIRSQLEQGARTTNGTHKINQQLLASINVPLPPLPAQKRFAEVVAGVSQLLDRYKSHLEEDLFDSLIQRAFRGEL